MAFRELREPYKGTQAILEKALSLLFTLQALSRTAFIIILLIPSAQSNLLADKVSLNDYTRSRGQCVGADLRKSLSLIVNNLLEKQADR